MKRKLMIELRGDRSQQEIANIGWKKSYNI